MGEKSALFNKGSLTKGQNPVSQPEKTNSSRSNNPSINRILHFQKAIGNKEVQGLIRTYILQTKLKIGKPKDKYEQEADRVAEKVMTMPMPGVDQISSRQGREGEKHTPKKPFFQTISLLLKKKEEDEEKVQPAFILQQKAEEDEEIQPKPLILREELEGEKEEEEEEVKTKPLIQEQQEEAEEEEEEKVQAKELPGYIPEIPPNIETDINNMRGGGQPLSVNTLAFFEPRFGYDFSPVKVHTDSRAASASESIHARAFSIGHNIFFGEGQYKPEKTEGRHLIAHELTHVVQQGGGRALNKAKIINRWYSHLNKSEHFLVQKEDDEKEKGQSEWLHKKLGPLNIDRVNDAKMVQGSFLDWVAEKGSAAVKGVKKLGSKIKKGITAAVGPLIEKAKGYIADKVKNVPGYELATYILGKDPITQKKVSKGPGGFLKLIFKLLGAEETYDKLAESKVVNKAYGLLMNALRLAKLTWGFIVKSIKGIWDFLTKNPLGLITALDMAKDFFFSLVSKTIQVGKSVLTKIPLLVLEGFLILVGAPVKRIMGIINKGKEVILLIANNPIKFVSHLIGALKKGFFQFKDNIWKHLKAGLLGWLFGTLQKAGITMPEKFDLKGIFSLVMQILGITYARIREKVVKVIGEKNMQRLEKAWEFIKALVTGGIGALWEKIKESLGNLKDMVIGAIKNWVVTKIVVSAISKLASMFNPVGAIIQAALTIYNTIMFFIERAKQIAALVKAVFNSIANIAYGKITAAANWIEKTMARSIPVILSFLACLLNLGGIAEKIKKVIGRIQEKVDKAIDKVINKIVSMFKKLFGRGKGKTGEDPEKVEKLSEGLHALDVLNTAYENKEVDREKLIASVAEVKSKHPIFKTLKVKEEKMGFIYYYTASPEGKKPGPVYEKNWTVGEHPAEPPEKLKGKKGDSHHVPFKVLKQWISKILRILASFYQTESNSQRSKDLKKKAEEYEKNKKGERLSAIWLTEENHNIVHSSEPLNNKDIEDLENQIRSDNAILIKTKKRKISSKPFLSTIESSANLPKFKIEESPEEVESVFKKVFNGLLETGVKYVARAKNLVPDGWEKALRECAKRTWERYLKVY